LSAQTDKLYNYRKVYTVANIDRQTTLTPAVAAQRLGVEVYTVRRWCDWHAAHLSPGASPGPGALRRLTQRDVEVLRYVRLLRAQGLTTTTINEQLHGLSFAEIDTDDHNADSSELAPPSAPDGLQQSAGMITALESLQRQITAIREASEQSKPARFDFVQGVAFGFIAAGLFFLIIVFMAWLYGG